MARRGPPRQPVLAHQVCTNIFLYLVQLWNLVVSHFCISKSLQLNSNSSGFIIHKFLVWSDGAVSKMPLWESCGNVYDLDCYEIQVGVMFSGRALSKKSFIISSILNIFKFSNRPWRRHFIFGLWNLTPPDLDAK